MPPRGRRGGTTRAIQQREEAQSAAGTGPRRGKSPKDATDDGSLIVLVQRGITPRQRHLVRDASALLPRARIGEKLPRHVSFEALQDACFLADSGMRALFLPARFEDEMWLWLVRLPHGPSVRFQVINLHTVAELNLQYEVRRVRHPCLLNFDAAFDTLPHLRLIREMLRATFSRTAPPLSSAAARSAHAEPRVGVSNGSSGSELVARPFLEFRTVISFFFVEQHIWIRAFDVVASESDPQVDELRERGPRLVLTPQRVVSSVLDGAALWTCA